MLLPSVHLAAAGQNFAMHHVSRSAADEPHTGDSSTLEALVVAYPPSGTTLLRSSYAFSKADQRQQSALNDRLGQSWCCIHILSPCIRYIAAVVGLEWPMALEGYISVLSGRSIPDTWYFAFDIRLRWLYVFDNGSCHLWSYADA